MQLPKVKDVHLPYRTGDGAVRIGGGLYGLAAEIRDPHGWVWAALGLMDGTRSRPQVADALQQSFPALEAATASALVDQLAATGYLEDGALQEPEELSGSERERYARNREFFRRIDLRPFPGHWDAQLRLKRSRVVVLGLGGTGSHAAWALVASGVGKVRCVDPDRVELANLTRQVLYTEADLGLPKAQVAAERLRAVNSQVQVGYDTRHVDGPAALAEIIDGFDLLVLCADEPDSTTLRGWATEVCARAAIPWVGGGYDGPLVSVGVFSPEGPCFDCVTAGEEARLDTQPPPLLGGRGVIAPSAGISGHLLAYEAITLLTGVSQQAPGYIRAVNLIAPDAPALIRHPARPDCPHCHATC